MAVVDWRVTGSGRELGSLVVLLVFKSGGIPPHSKSWRTIESFFNACRRGCGRVRFGSEALWRKFVEQHCSAWTGIRYHQQ